MQDILLSNVGYHPETASYIEKGLQICAFLAYTTCILPDYRSGSDDGAYFPDNRAWSPQLRNVPSWKGWCSNPHIRLWLRLLEFPWKCSIKEVWERIYDYREPIRLGKRFWQGCAFSHETQRLQVKGRRLLQWINTSFSIFPSTHSDLTLYQYHQQPFTHLLYHSSISCLLSLHQSPDQQNHLHQCHQQALLHQQHQH